MKKPVIVLTALVAAGLASTQAYAQSTVTVYGLIDAAATFSRGSEGASLPASGTPRAAYNVKRLDSSVGPASRLGFRGTEELGDGMAARFVAEMGLGVDTGVSQQGGLPFGRQIWVGLGGPTWQVSAGRQYSPMATAIVNADPTTGAYWGNPYTTIGLGTFESIGGPAGTQATGRVDNSILYMQQMGPLSASLMYGLGNELGNRKSGRTISPGLHYVSGPLRLDLAAAWTNQQDGAIVPTAQPETLKSWVAGVNYDFGVAKLVAGYYTLTGPTQRANLSAAFLASPYTLNWSRMNAQWIGAKVPFGLSNIYITYTGINYEIPSSPNGKSKVLMAAYEYNLSKRTALYGSVARMTNNALANTALTAAVSQLPVNGYGADYNALSFGVRHVF